MALVQLIPGNNRHLMRFYLPRDPGARSVIYVEVRAERDVRVKVWRGIDAMRQETACEGRPQEMWADLRGREFNASLGPENGFEGGFTLIETVALAHEGDPFELHIEAFARTVHMCE